MSINFVGDKERHFALAFAKEAKYDLEIANLILKYVDTAYKESGEAVFYINRRILYLLQQASEKILKAYVMSFFVDLAGFIVKVVGKLDRNKFPRIYRIYKKIAKLTPQQIGHKVHKDFLIIIRALYNLICIYREETIQYIKLFLNKLDSLIEVFKSEILKTPNLSDSEKNNLIKDLELLIDRVKKDILTVFSSIKCSEQIKLDEKVLSKSLQPPCLARTLKAYLDMKNNINNVLKSLEPTLKEKVESKVSEYKPFIIRIFKQFVKVDVAHIEVTINEAVRTLSNLRIFLYPIAFLPLYMCLHWYESGGRYPDRIVEVGIDKVREDIIFVKRVADAVGEIVDLLSDTIITLYENGSVHRH